MSIEAHPETQPSSDELPVDEGVERANVYVEWSRGDLDRAEAIVPDEDRTRRERAREKLPQAIGLPAGVSVEQVLSRDEHIRPRLWLAFHIASGASWNRIYDTIEKRLQETSGEMIATTGTDVDPLLTEILRIKYEIKTRREYEARTSFLDQRNATWQNIETRQEALHGIKMEISRNIHFPPDAWEGLFGDAMVIPEGRKSTIAVSLGLPQTALWERIFPTLEERLGRELASHSQDRLYAAVVRSALRKIDTFHQSWGIRDGHGETGNVSWEALEQRSAEIDRQANELHQYLRLPPGVTLTNITTSPNERLRQSIATAWNRSPATTPWIVIYRQLEDRLEERYGPLDSMMNSDTRELPEYRHVYSARQDLRSRINSGPRAISDNQQTEVREETPIPGGYAESNPDTERPWSEEPPIEMSGM